MQLSWASARGRGLGRGRGACERFRLAIVFVGLNSSPKGEECGVNIPGFLGGDRTSLDLPEPQENRETAIAPVNRSRRSDTAARK